MSDLIERQAAIDALRAAYWDKNIQSAKDDPCIVDAMTDWAIRQMEALPPAQPEIVRCKDCKWWDEIEGSEGVYGYCMAIRHCYLTRNWDIEIHRKYDKGFYCADAEMPEVEE